MAKSLLVISRQAPWSGLGAREALDLVLAGGAFDLPISLLFLDDGVFQLLPEQKPEALQQKDVTANLAALPLFGVEQLYAARTDLVQRGLGESQLALESVRILEDGALADLINRHDQVMTF
ncbi:tRNA 2-thiouridine synthesizing protein C [Azomonas agilis]|uniref:tRNA 2-thiouridine synthesizing protein C n=1 Tax=Azomonas agilis TaxID=116849 RepID=A0A562HZT8_9GAMM|nr:sulfurtransferase complex subunit TusC [Azomonas agilis]TWH63903.1 tRNA 2-thiouridine synthesizing protein C [Azomonas agilis]